MDQPRVPTTVPVASARWSTSPLLLLAASSVVWLLLMRWMRACLVEQRCRRRGSLLLTLSSVALLAGALAAALLSPYLAVGSDHRITMDARGGGGWAAACRNTLPAACSHPLLMPALVLILLAIACGASWPTAASGKGARGAAWATCLAAAAACLPGAAAAPVESSASSTTFSWFTEGGAIPLSFLFAVSVFAATADLVLRQLRWRRNSTAAFSPPVFSPPPSPPESAGGPSDVVRTSSAVMRVVDKFSSLMRPPPRRPLLPRPSTAYVNSRRIRSGPILSAGGSPPTHPVPATSRDMVGRSLDVRPPMHRCIVWLLTAVLTSRVFRVVREQIYGRKVHRLRRHVEVVNGQSVVRYKRENSVRRESELRSFALIPLTMTVLWLVATIFDAWATLPPNISRTVSEPPNSTVFGIAAGERPPFIGCEYCEQQCAPCATCYDGWTHVYENRFDRCAASAGPCGYPFGALRHCSVQCAPFFALGRQGLHCIERSDDFSAFALVAHPDSTGSGREFCEYRDPSLPIVRGVDPWGTQRGRVPPSLYLPNGYTAGLTGCGCGVRGCPPLPLCRDLPLFPPFARSGSALAARRVPQRARDVWESRALELPAPRAAPLVWLPPPYARQRQARQRAILVHAC